MARAGNLLSGGALETSGADIELGGLFRQTSLSPRGDQRGHDGARGDRRVPRLSVFDGRVRSRLPIENICRTGICLRDCRKTSSIGWSFAASMVTSWWHRRKRAEPSNIIGRASPYCWRRSNFFKVPWLCNASLSGLALVLIHRITQEITGDRRAAGWAQLFTVASGAFAADALSYYSMQAHLTANLLFVALLFGTQQVSGFRRRIDGFAGIDTA